MYVDYTRNFNKLLQIVIIQFSYQHIIDQMKEQINKYKKITKNQSNITKYTQLFHSEYHTIIQLWKVLNHKEQEQQQQIVVRRTVYKENNVCTISSQNLNLSQGNLRFKQLKGFWIKGITKRVTNLNFRYPVYRELTI